jgi:nucleoside-diphosphate-sugar epimerase
VKEKKNKGLVLVTGGAGYKGSTLCRELIIRGYKVRVLDSLMYGARSLSGLFNHPDFEFVKGDVTIRRDLSNAVKGADYVIHLAAIVGDKPCERDPKHSIEVNYKATAALADLAAKEKVKRFVFASTCSNYGIADTSVPADENRELHPVSLYAETKIDCEKYLIQLYKEKKLKAVMLRFSTAFGVSGRTRFDLTINSFTYEAMRDNKIIAYAKDSWRPFTHVLDMARIYCAMLEIPAEFVHGQIFNAGWNSENYTKEQIINMILEVLGDFEVDYMSNIEDKRSYRVDFTKIENVLKLKKAVSLKEGIAEVAYAIKSGFLTENDFECNRLK